MFDFKKYILFDSAACQTTGNKQVQSSIIESFRGLMAFMNRYPNTILAEAKKKDPTIKSRTMRDPYPHRLPLNRPEEDIYSQSLSAGDTAASAIGSLRSGQIPAVKAISDAMGVSQDQLRKIRQGGSVEVKDISPEALHKKMKASGEPILPAKYKDAYTKHMMYQIRDKVQAKQSLTPEEQDLYEKWQAVAKDTQIAGNAPPPFTGLAAQPGDISPERYDALRKALTQGKSAVQKYQKSFIDHYMTEEARLFPPEIAMNVDAAYEKIKAQFGDPLPDETVELMYINKVRDDILSGKGYLPNPETANQPRRPQRWAQTNFGTASPSIGLADPSKTPGVLQALTQKVKGVTTKQGKRVDDELSDFPIEDFPEPYTGLNRERVAFPDDKINKMYQKDAAAFEDEILNPARRAAGGKFDKGDQEEASQEIALMMLGATGLDGWRDSEPLRRHWANIYAMRQRDRVMKGQHIATGASGDEFDRVGTAGEKTQIKGGEAYTKSAQTKAKKATKKAIGKGVEGIDKSDMSEEDVQELDRANDMWTSAMQTGDRKAGAKALGILQDLGDRHPAIADVINTLLAQIQEL